MDTTPQRVTPQRIAEYLRGLAHTHDVVPCTVQIAKTCYPAARYKTTTTLSAGTRAYAEGQRTVTQEWFYVVGSLPAMKRRGNVAFTLDGDGRDWFVAFYFPAHTGRQPQPIAEPTDYHPFGNTFGLSPWEPASLTDKIDSYAPVPYKRAPLTVVPWEG